MDNDLNGENKALEASKVIDEFAVAAQKSLPLIPCEPLIEPLNPLPSIVNFTDKLVSDKLNDERQKIIQTNEYSDRAKDVSKASLDVSIDSQNLNVKEREIDNAITAHKIEIKKHELDIAAEHEFKRLNYEKKIERAISKREHAARNKESKLIAYKGIKADSQLKTDNLFVLWAISFCIALGDFFKGLSYTFKNFNGLLKFLIVSALVAAAIMGLVALWKGLDLGKYINFN